MAEGTRDRRHEATKRAAETGHFQRAGSFLSDLLPGLLPGLLSLTMLLAFAPQVAADSHAAAGAAGGSDAMQKMMEEQLDRIPSGEAGVDRILSELTEQLTLTTVQQAEIRPTVEQSVAAMEKSRDQLKAGEIAPMAMAMQMQMIGQKAAVQIEPVLTEEQLVAYKKMRQQQRRQMMQAMQRQRASMSGAAAGGGGSQ